MAVGNDDVDIRSLDDLKASLNNEVQLRQNALRELDAFERSLIEKQLQKKQALVTAQVKAEQNIRDSFNKKLQAAEAKKDKEAEKRLKELQAKRLKNLEEYYKKEEEKQKALAERQEKLDKIAADRQKKLENNAKVKDEIFGAGKTITERVSALSDVGIDGLVSGLANMAKALDNQIDKIASYKAQVDTRLNGLAGSSRLGSHWDYYNNRITGVAGISPFVKQSDVANKLMEYINRGIAYNVDQRAFLATVSENIATTFDAANGTLLEIVRVQQSDSTAARLGMEASLNAYLNSMYQNTEYLGSISQSVTSSIYQATSLMNSADSIGFEYQIQKWLGSLYSVGMSQNAISGIAGALGALGSGDVSKLNGSAFNNLLVMAASRMGGRSSYADILTNGLTAETANALMSSMVEYLASIANSNKVVQSQYAAVYGLSTADIKAASNLVSSVADISRSSLGYSDAMGSLFNMAGSMWQRVSLGEMMSNIWENAKYSMSAGIANNPALYAIWKAAGLLEDTVGGIALPDIKVLGTGVNLQTTVADLMRVGSLSGGILSSIGQMIAAGSGGGLSGQGMLEALGINKGTISSLVRGTGSSVKISGSSVSQSAYVGNSSGSDIYESTMASAEEDQKSKMVEAKEEDTSVNLDTIDNHIVEINANIASIKASLEGVISGNEVIVKVADYGLVEGIGRI